jgi:histone acetyltransferase (RNA polymerase elongator complex component)
MIIPFFIPHAGCPHQCVFCDQKNITGRRAPPPLSSVPATIGRYLQTYTGSGSVQVAFYGGSFTGLPLEVQQAYLEPVQPFIEARQILDIRLSTRPDGISDDVLALLKRYHVGTVELGVQSMDDDVLLLSGRGHTAADTVRAVQLLRKHGFTRGLQLMPGLPGDKVETFQDTVRQVVGLRPDFVRIYPALVIRDRSLFSTERADTLRSRSMLRSRCAVTPWTVSKKRGSKSSASGSRQRTSSQLRAPSLPVLAIPLSASLSSPPGS